MKEKELSIAVMKRMQRVFQQLQASDGLELVEFIELIYSATDFYYKKVIEPDAVCSKGCGWCCRVPVTVSALEAKYIEIKTGIIANDLDPRKDHRRKPDKTKCPFLKNEMCSIYDHRPFNCRVFASMDSPEFCVDGSTSHQIVNWQSNGGLTAFRECLDMNSCEIAWPAQASHADVREWFNKEIKIKQIGD